MTIQTLRTFARLGAGVRRYAIAVALVAASAHAAAAAPLTLTYSFDLGGSDFAKFDTTQGTLLGIDISLKGRLAATNPFANVKGFFGDPCGAVFSGGTITVSAAGTPTLLEMTAGGSRTFSCEQREPSFGGLAAAAVAPAFFAVFSSAGASPMTLNLTITSGTATLTHGPVAITTDAYWLPFLHQGLVTYTYCPVGEDCSTPLPPSPPSVPEPATAVLVALGLAGTLRSVGRRPAHDAVAPLSSRLPSEKKSTPLGSKGNVARGSEGTVCANGVDRPAGCGISLLLATVAQERNARRKIRQAAA